LKRLLELRKKKRKIKIRKTKELVNISKIKEAVKKNMKMKKNKRKPIKFFLPQ
jgi:hypothetical protein